MNLSNVCSQTLFLFIFLCLSRVYEVDTLTCRCTARRDCIPKKNICVTDGVCYAVTLISRYSDSPVTEYGCHNAEVLHPVGNPFVCHYNHQKAHLNAISCCKNEDFCNEQPQNRPTLGPAPKPIVKDREPVEYLLIMGLSITGILLFAILASWLLWYASCRRKQSTGEMKKDLSDHRLLGSAGSTSTKIDIEHTETGSGSGLPTFIPRTIAREIELNVIVGTGRYGEVWRGTWKGEHVAVKIFHSREERSWFREAEIYQTVMLRHENILGFIAADNKDNGTWTQLWLVTDYHPHGSLFDYLNSTEISTETMLGMLFTISSGLSHLHMEIIGTQGKPGIAHRDLKSKNILVKKNLECCIADLGLAVKHFSEQDFVDIAINSRVGTMRYMAPEIIEGQIDTRLFDCFTQADIYSLALVFWEVIRRCDEFGPPDEYQLPYFDCVPSDPTQEEMFKAIIVEKKRPRIYDKWREHKIFWPLCQVMTECWSYDASGRMNALRVKKYLMKIMDSHPQFTNRELLPTSSQV